MMHFLYQIVFATERSRKHSSQEEHQLLSIEHKLDRHVLIYENN